MQSDKGTAAATAANDSVSSVVVEWTCSRHPGPTLEGQPSILVQCSVRCILYFGERAALLRGEAGRMGSTSQLTVSSFLPCWREPFLVVSRPLTVTTRSAAARVKRLVPSTGTSSLIMHYTKSYDCMKAGRHTWVEGNAWSPPPARKVQSFRRKAGRKLLATLLGHMKGLSCCSVYKCPDGAKSGKFFFAQLYILAPNPGFQIYWRSVEFSKQKSRTGNLSMQLMVK